MAVLDHWYFHYPCILAAQNHAYVIIHLYPVNFKFIPIDIGNIGYKLDNLKWALVWHLEAIDVAYQCHNFPIDQFIFQKGSYVFTLKPLFSSLSWFLNKTEVKCATSRIYIFVTFRTNPSHLSLSQHISGIVLGLYSPTILKIVLLV